MISYTLSRAEGENVGTYAITPAGDAEQGNYDVVYVPGTLTITKATVAVTAEDKPKVYGDDDPELTATVTGLKNGDEASVITYTLSRAAGEDVGTYAITPAGEAEQGNYDVVYVPGTLTITKATVTVTAGDKTKVYGDADPELTATVTGLKNGDEASVITYTLSRAAGEDVGTYAITPAGAAEQGNYDVVYVPGTLTITKATVTVTAEDKTKVYGDDDPELTATVTGLKNGDEASVITYTLSRAAGEDVGNYADHASGRSRAGQLHVRLRDWYADDHEGESDGDGGRQDEGLRRCRSGTDSNGHWPEERRRSKRDYLHAEPRTTRRRSTTTILLLIPL